MYEEMTVPGEGIVLQVLDIFTSNIIFIMMKIRVETNVDVKLKLRQYIWIGKVWIRQIEHILILYKDLRQRNDS